MGHGDIQDMRVMVYLDLGSDWKILRRRVLYYLFIFKPADWFVEKLLQRAVKRRETFSKVIMWSGQGICNLEDGSEEGQV